MAFIGYSPWNDAANVGQGIGSALGNVLLQVPLMKRQLAQEDRRYETLAAHQRAMENYQLQAAEERAEYKRLMLETKSAERIATQEARTALLQQKREAQKLANEYKLEGYANRVKVAELNNAVKMADIDRKTAKDSADIANDQGKTQILAERALTEKQKVVDATKAEVAKIQEEIRHHQATEANNAQMISFRGQYMNQQSVLKQLELEIEQDYRQGLLRAGNDANRIKEVKYLHDSQLEAIKTGVTAQHYENMEKIQSWTAQDKAKYQDRLGDINAFKAVAGYTDDQNDTRVALLKQQAEDLQTLVNAQQAELAVEVGRVNLGTQTKNRVGAVLDRQGVGTGAPAPGAPAAPGATNAPAAAVTPPTAAMVTPTTASPEPAFAIAGVGGGGVTQDSVAAEFAKEYGKQAVAERQFPTNKTVGVAGPGNTLPSFSYSAPVSIPGGFSSLSNTVPLPSISGGYTNDPLVLNTNRIAIPGFTNEQSNVSPLQQTNRGITLPQITNNPAAAQTVSPPDLSQIGTPITNRIVLPTANTNRQSWQQPVTAPTNGVVPAPATPATPVAQATNAPVAAPAPTIPLPPMGMQADDQYFGGIPAHQTLSAQDPYFGVPFADTAANEGAWRQYRQDFAPEIRQGYQATMQNERGGRDLAALFGSLLPPNPVNSRGPELGPMGGSPQAAAPGVDPRMGMLGAGSIGVPPGLIPPPQLGGTNAQFQASRPYEVPAPPGSGPRRQFRPASNPNAILVQRKGVDDFKWFNGPVENLDTNTWIVVQQ